MGPAALNSYARSKGGGHSGTPDRQCRVSLACFLLSAGVITEANSNCTGELSHYCDFLPTNPFPVESVVSQYESVQGPRHGAEVGGLEPLHSEEQGSKAPQYESLSLSKFSKFNIDEEYVHIFVSFESEYIASKKCYHLSSLSHPPTTTTITTF